MSQQHTSDDHERLIAYLYDECDAAERAQVDAHLAQCPACREELDGFRAVRSRLAHWVPPEREPGFVLGPRSRQTPWWVTWRVPMQAAAAVLVLALGAAVAHVEVRYGATGLVVRTGWATAPAAATPAGRAPEQAPPARAAGAGLSAQALAPELTAFESRVERQLKNRAPAGAVQAVSPGDAVLLKRVRALVKQSEQRQQREFAMRLMQAMQDMEYQRRADLVRIDQNLGQIEGTTGAAVARQKELWNYLVQVAQQHSK